MIQMADIHMRDDKLAKRLLEIHAETPFDDDPYHNRIISAATRLVELGYDAVYITSHMNSTVWFENKNKSTAFRVRYVENTDRVDTIEVY